MPEIDHLVFASPDVAAGVSLLRTLTGVQAVEGGRHVGLGTHNHLLTFDDRTYFEIIGIDPDQDQPDGPLPFGLEPGTEPALVGYAVHPTGDETLEDVVAAIADAGFDPGRITEMSRRKPNGELLSWRLTTGGDNAGGVVPFAIEWENGSSPATSLPSMGSLQALEVAHPDDSVRGRILDLCLGVGVSDGPVGLRALVGIDSGSVWVS
jgi:hypothetical protein